MAKGVTRPISIFALFLLSQARQTYTMETQLPRRCDLSRSYFSAPELFVASAGGCGGERSI